MSVVELPADLQRAVEESEQAQREMLREAILAEVVPYLPGNRVILCPRFEILVLGTVLGQREALRAQEAARAAADQIPALTPTRARGGRRRSRRR